MSKRLSHLLVLSLFAALTFEATRANAMGPECRELLTGEQVQAVDVPPQLQKRPVWALNDESQKTLLELREVRKTAPGGANTTDERSEFKFFMIQSLSRDIVAMAEKLFPSKYSVDGRLLSGVASRDFRVTISQQDLEKTFPPAAITRLEVLKLMNAAKFPDVLDQPDIQAQFAELAKTDPVLKQYYPNLLNKILAMGRQARAVQNQPRDLTYTDTASTAKFLFRDSLTRQSIVDAAQEVSLDASVLQNHEDWIQLAQSLAQGSPDDLAVRRSQLLANLKSVGVKKELATQFMDSIETRASSSFVFRFRKYLNGPANASLDGLPAPGEKLARDQAALKDAKFSAGITWFELKIKTSHGEDALSTVVNKPRVPLSDSVASLLQDPSAFLDDVAFARTTDIVKKDAQEQSKKVKAQYFDKEIDLALQLVRSIHQQRMSMQTVGRTVYTRESQNVNFEDPTSKSHNNQVTIDSQVWELNRASGHLVEALPYVETTHNWHFQFDHELGWFVHRNEANGQIDHVMNPKKTSDVFAVINGKIQKAAISGLNLQQTVVTELKVPVEFIRLSPADIARVPELAKIRQLFDQMNQASDDYNSSRSAVGLFEAAKNRGKRSFARNGNGGGIPMNVASKNGSMSTKFFQFNPESGYWIAWGEDGHTPMYAYRHDIGVVKINLAPGKDWLKDGSSVAFQPRELLTPATENNLD